MREWKKMPMIWPEGGDLQRARNPCSCCGKNMATSNTRWMVHLVDGGANVLHPDDYDDYMKSGHDNGEMGLHPVGNSCRKKFNGFAAKVDVSGATWDRIG